jgi:putative nucleotidyltransferase with HDIG domain
MSKKERKLKVYGTEHAKKVPSLLILIVTGVIAFIVLVLPEITSNSLYQLSAGDVVTQDILAPYSLTYESPILTEKVQQEAAARVEPVYLPADPSIGRYQIETLRSVMYFISTIRQDAFANNDQKISDLLSIKEISLSYDSAQNILDLSDQSWEKIQSEAALLLEQMMRNTIRSTNLTQVRNSVPSIVDYSFQEEQTSVIIDLVTPLIIPNSLFSEEKTQAAIESAISSISPITRSFISGETLIRRGQILNIEVLEALDQYGLIQRGDIYNEIIAAAIIVFVICIFIGSYFSRRQLPFTNNLRSMLLISIVFISFLGVARFFVIDRTIIPYLYPLAAFGLSITIIFNLEIGMIFSLALGVLTAFGSPKGFDLTLFYIIPCLIGMLIIGKAKRIATFIGSAMGIGLIGAGIILAYRLPDSVTDWVGIATLSAASMVNGFLSASLALFLQYIFSQWLDIVTSLRLMDLTRPDHPLLQFMLKNAPGSYQHSLMVSNLAESAAEAINANALLVRTGAIYHDCGKGANSQFFIENQIPDQINSHEDIDHVTSAATIIQHVIDGVELAKKYHLPSQVIDFIREHHGTLITRYQYAKAMESATSPEDIDSELFRYPGPKPRSRETGILMLADGTEARARAELPKDDDAIRALIGKVIAYCMNEGQLMDTDLTLRDLEIVAHSFFDSLRRIYHPRIQYPEPKALLKP